MKFKLSKVISHEALEEPKETSQVIEAKSLSQLVHNLLVSGAQACDLKNYKKTQWIDEHGGTHVLSIEEITQ